MGKIRGLRLLYHSGPKVSTASMLSSGVGACLHGKVLRSLKIWHIHLGLPFKDNINCFGLNHSVSPLITLLIKAVVFPLKRT